MNSDSITFFILKVLALLLLVSLNAFFVVAELAMVRIRDSQLASALAKGDRRAKTARHILAHIDAYIGATQFGITMVSLGLGVTVEPIFNGLLGPLYDMIGIKSESLREHISIGAGFFHQLLSALSCWGNWWPHTVAIRLDAAGGIVDGAAVDALLPDLLSIHLAVIPVLGLVYQTAGHWRRRTARWAIRGRAADRAGWPPSGPSRAAQPDLERP